MKRKTIVRVSKEAFDMLWHVHFETAPGQLSYDRVPEAQALKIARKLGPQGPVLPAPRIDPKAVRYTLTAEPESFEMRPEFELDGETVEWIERELKDGNEWAWCTAHVTASAVDRETGRTVYGHDYLGGCSYKSAEDFKAPGGYYRDMCDDALKDLLRRIDSKQ